ncbi:hemicentin-2-like isoform X1 [Simochromis diagramma]|uniref:hemicentin-2-like isoform X1 n=1 Tax=Simochromis diagramma TaxID=43689 RepID=UPI001A7EE426|nr:hemicentin-2-like isoform X1 [Simochromis diagramma]
MASPGWAVALMLFQLFHSGTSYPVFTNTPSLPPEIALPFSNVSLVASPITPGESTQSVLCPLKISPSTVVVRFGDPVKANCSLQRMGYFGIGWEVPLNRPNFTSQGFLVWSVEKMTDWTIKPVCFALSDHRGQCYSKLTLIVYKPPDRVSITFLNHSESLFEGDQYTLQCHVTEVAPAENVLVTFYRGEKMLAQMHSNTSSEKKPVTQSFTLNIISSKEDTEAQYWCEAKLELGPEGPQHLPVMASQRLFAPQLSCPVKLKVTEGERFPCEVTGNPQPSVTWFRNGQIVAPPSHLNKKDAGNYTIQAKGLFSKNFTVEVKILPARGTANSCCGHFLLLVLLNQMITHV